MRRNCLLFLAVLSLAFAFATGAHAQDEAPKERTRSKVLFGQPVNVNIAGGGTLPQGMALTMLNASFADKDRSKKGYAGSDIFSQTWLFKARYGITNHLEIAYTAPYINNERRNPSPSPEHIEGFADQVIQLTFAPWNQHQQDPVSLGFTFGILTPTGNVGKNHIPGVGAWGYRLATGIGKFVTKEIKLDTEVAYSGPFERGNQNVKRGDQFQWNSNARYVFERFDIGLESTFIHQESGDKRTPRGTLNIRNGYTEWFVGPSVNVAIEPLGMWAGVGAFFPVLQDVKGPAAVEDARFEFKLGKVW